MTALGKNCARLDVLLRAGSGGLSWSPWLFPLGPLQQASAITLQGVLLFALIELPWASRPLQVADFNLSHRMQQRSGQEAPQCGNINSPEWAAPERLAGEAYSFSADVFSFGVVLWELVTLREPIPYTMYPILPCSVLKLQYGC